MLSDRMSDVVGVWERRFCVTSWCPTEVLYVQRKGEGLDLWRVAENPNEPEWLVAAAEPVCPYCGGHLPTAANLDDGIDDIAA